MNIRKMLPTALVLGALIGLAVPGAGAATFTPLPLVSDDAVAVPAQITDARLVNAWGLSYAPGGPWWASANGTGISPVYKVDPTSQTPSIQGVFATIPGDGSVTGQAYQNSAGFNKDLFLFVSEDGTVSGWRSALGSSAEVLVPASDANVYKGAAVGTMRRHTYLYAANFRSGKIDVVKGMASWPNLRGTFKDPNLPAGYAPFNIQNLGGTLYVAYAVQDADKKDEVAGPGLGIVSRFNLSGKFLGRVATGGPLNAPWALAVAPASFGSMAGALLVGNFGDGRITAYDPNTLALLGQINGPNGQPLVIDGLWALAPGNGGQGGSADKIYYTAGPAGESHGVFGVLMPNP